jgi:hypothetical protein
MKHKPLIFTILSILCLIEPLIKILYFKVTTNFDFDLIFQNLAQRTNPREIFDFWLVFPIAGLLLIKIRRFSYFAFMSLLVYIFYGILTYESYTWPYYSKTPFLYNYVVVFAALGVFVYFLMPRVREPFFNQRVRWWETKARYPVNLECGLKSETQAFASEILNLSLTGAFIKDSPYLKEGDRLTMEFTYDGNTISIPAEIVHRNVASGKEGFGVKFHYKSFRQNVQMSQIINNIKRSKAPR